MSWDLGFPDGPSGKEPTCQCRRHKRWGFDPWVRKIPWRRTWQPTPVFLPGESHGQRSLAGYSPQEAKSGTQLKQLCTHVIGSRVSFLIHYANFCLLNWEFNPFTLKFVKEDLYLLFTCFLYFLYGFCPVSPLLLSFLFSCFFVMACVDFRILW